MDYTEGVGAASIIRNFGKKNFLNVKTITIDDLVKINNIKPNFIKLDIEGAEFEALQGSLNTSSMPKVKLELCEDVLTSSRLYLSFRPQALNSI